MVVVVVGKATRRERTASGQGSIAKVASHWEAQPSPVSWVLSLTLNFLALLVYLAPSRPSVEHNVRELESVLDRALLGNPNASH